MGVHKYTRKEDFSAPGDVQSGTMTALQNPTTPPTAGPLTTRPTPPPPNNAATVRPKASRSMSNVQRVVIAAAALPLVGIVLTAFAAAIGIISVNDMIDISLALGEDPGMVVFAAMLFCSPVQWLVKRTQIPVRKVLGILFAGYAFANFAMFVIDEGLVASVSEPFLVAGTFAMLLSIPLLLTSGRWAQRQIGMKNWRKLHKLTYVIALALVLHVALVGELGLTGVFVLVALLTRIPPVAHAIRALGERLR